MASKILLVGGGGVGTIGALNLEASGRAEITMVLRSNFDTVKKSGYRVKSCDHGEIDGWRPTRVINHVPTANTEEPFDYIVLTTKNNPDIPPSATELVAPAVTPRHTVIVLIQNGLNIEKPFIKAFPFNIVLSGISLIGSLEPSLGLILQDDKDRLTIGPFRNPALTPSDEDLAAKSFVALYSASGKAECTFSTEVSWTRWRKLVYNACLNPICAITGLDTGRLRLAEGIVEGLVKPAMEEIRAAAKAAGEVLPEDIVDFTINIDPLELYMKPSMMMDAQKGNYLEFENLLGEPLREGKRLGVPMPTLEVFYNICKAIQWKTKEQRGLVTVSVKR